MIPFLLKSSAILSLGLLLIACSTTPDFYQAHNLFAKPFNQLELSGNVCGPTALLNSSKFGSKDWQIISNNPPNLSDRQRIRSITFGPGLRPSESLKGRTRWSSKGINLTDLRHLANEVALAHGLPNIDQQTLFISPTETQQNHLLRVHKNLSRSLSKGFPPILSIRRYIKRNEIWINTEGHYVTITSVPGKITQASDSFEVSYIDPWGGKHSNGKIAIRHQPFLGDQPNSSPNLEAIFPQATVGKSLVRKGEQTLLIVSASLSVR